MSRAIFCKARLFLAATGLIASAVLASEAVATENAVLEWNAIATEAFLPSQGTDPLNQSRAYAMLHAAIHDALNAVDQRYEFYTPGLSPMPMASTDAAVAAAARDVLVALVPSQQPLIRSSLCVRPRRDSERARQIPRRAVRPDGGSAHLPAQSRRWRGGSVRGPVRSDRRSGRLHVYATVRRTAVRAVGVRSRLGSGHAVRDRSEEASPSWAEPDQER